MWSYTCDNSRVLTRRFSRFVGKLSGMTRPVALHTYLNNKEILIAPNCAPNFTNFSTVSYRAASYKKNVYFQLVSFPLLEK